MLIKTMSMENIALLVQEQIILPRLITIYLVEFGLILKELMQTCGNLAIPTKENVGTIL